MKKKVVDGAARAIQTFECWRREKKFFLAGRQVQDDDERCFIIFFFVSATKRGNLIFRPCIIHYLAGRQVNTHTKKNGNVLLRTPMAAKNWIELADYFIGRSRQPNGSTLIHSRK